MWDYEKQNTITYEESERHECQGLDTLKKSSNFIILYVTHAIAIEFFFQGVSEYLNHLVALVLLMLF